MSAHQPPLNEEDKKIVSEILELADDLAQGEDAYIDLRHVLHAYPEVLSRRGIAPTHDTIYYRFLLKLNMLPEPDWWKKFEHECRRRELRFSAVNHYRRTLLARCFVAWRRWNRSLKHLRQLGRLSVPVRAPSVAGGPPNRSSVSPLPSARSMGSTNAAPTSPESLSATFPPLPPPPAGTSITAPLVITPRTAAVPLGDVVRQTQGPLAPPAVARSVPTPPQQPMQVPRLRISSVHADARRAAAVELARSVSAHARPEGPPMWADQGSAPFAPPAPRPGGAGVVAGPPSQLLVRPMSAPPVPPATRTATAAAMPAVATVGGTQPSSSATFAVFSPRTGL